METKKQGIAVDHEPAIHKKARRVNHQAGFANRFGINLHSRRTIPASPSNDESVACDVDVVVKVVMLVSRIDGPKQRHAKAR